MMEAWENQEVEVGGEEEMGLVNTRWRTWTRATTKFDFLQGALFGVVICIQRLA
jgi:hypothetical protein